MHPRYHTLTIYRSGRQSGPYPYYHRRSVLASADPRTWHAVTAAHVITLPDNRKLIVRRKGERSNQP